MDLLRTCGWYAARIAFTLAGLWTIQNLIAAEGHVVQFQTLVIVSAIVLIAVRLWMPAREECACGQACRGKADKPR